MQLYVRRYELSGIFIFSFLIANELWVSLFCFVFSAYDNFFFSGDSIVTSFRTNLSSYFGFFFIFVITFLKANSWSYFGFFHVIAQSTFPSFYFLCVFESRLVNYIIPTDALTVMWNHIFPHWQLGARGREGSATGSDTRQMMQHKHHTHWLPHPPPHTHQTATQDSQPSKHCKVDTRSLSPLRLPLSPPTQGSLEMKDNPAPVYIPLE